MTPKLEVEKRVLEAWPAKQWQGGAVLVAVSGGADSVALLSALARLAGSSPTAATRIVGCHFNHGLRDADSDEDEQFVRQLCQMLDVACEIGRAEAGAFDAVGGEGIESTARKLRYDFLMEAAQRWQAQFVVTAHTANDQAETVLHRILRGTGLAGLAGIPFSRELTKGVEVVRPLLHLPRQRLLEYLDLLGQDFRHDSSNDDVRFTRNRLRHDLLPELRQHYNSKVDDSLTRLAQLAGEAQQVIEQEVDRLQRAVKTNSDGKVLFDCRRLAGHPAYLIRELCIAVWRQHQWPLQSMGQQEWQTLATLIASSNDRSAQERLMLPGSITAQKKGGQLTLTRP